MNLQEQTYDADNNEWTREIFNQSKGKPDEIQFYNTPVFFCPAFSFIRHFRPLKRLL